MQDFFQQWTARFHKRHYSIAFSPMQRIFSIKSISKAFKDIYISTIILFFVHSYD